MILKRRTVILFGVFSVITFTPGQTSPTVGSPRIIHYSKNTSSVVKSLDEAPGISWGQLQQQENKNTSTTTAEEVKHHRNLSPPSSSLIKHTQKFVNNGQIRLLLGHISPKMRSNQRLPITRGSLLRRKPRSPDALPIPGYIPLNSLTLAQHHHSSESQPDQEQEDQDAWWRRLPKEKVNKNKAILSKLDEIKKSTPEWPWMKKGQIKKKKMKVQRVRSTPASLGPIIDLSTTTMTKVVPTKTSEESNETVEETQKSSLGQKIPMLVTSPPSYPEWFLTAFSNTEPGLELAETTTELTDDNLIQKRLGVVGDEEDDEKVTSRARPLISNRVTFGGSNNEERYSKPVFNVDKIPDPLQVFPQKSDVESRIEKYPQLVLKDHLSRVDGEEEKEVTRYDLDQEDLEQQRHAFKELMDLSADAKKIVSVSDEDEVTLSPLQKLEDDSNLIYNLRNPVNYKPATTTTTTTTQSWINKNQNTEPSSSSDEGLGQRTTTWMSVKTSPPNDDDYQTSSSSASSYSSSPTTTYFPTTRISSSSSSSNMSPNDHKRISTIVPMINPTYDHHQDKKDELDVAKLHQHVEELVKTNKRIMETMMHQLSVQSAILQQLIRAATTFSEVAEIAEMSSTEDAS